MKSIDFLKHRNKFFLLSAIVIAVGIIFFMINGLNLDIQFKGGTRILVETNDMVDINQAKQLIEENLGKSVTAQMLQTYNPEDEDGKIFMLRLDIASDETLTDEERGIVNDLVAENFDVKQGGNQEMLSVQPSIGQETLMNGLKALLIASILIVLYVTWRFSALSGFPAAITAILALVHDILIVFALYTVFKIPVNEVFIAAVLTILGYSLNDTIVVYDRIRENSKNMKKHTLDDIVSVSINQSLSRTINTTTTTLIVVIALYVFAAINNIASLKEFSLPLIVGFISGTYSSIFVASPIWMIWRKSSMRKTLKNA